MISFATVNRFNNALQSGGATRVPFLPSWLYPRLLGRGAGKPMLPLCPNPCDTASATLPEDVRLYAIGNVHGMSSHLTSLFEMICEDAERTIRDRRMIIVLCGDYINHGPDSAGVLSFLSKMASPRLDMVALRGNHEDLLQCFMDEPSRYGPRWMENGGGETLRSYGLPLPPASPEGYLEARAGLWRCMPMSHVHFLAELKNNFTIGDYFFCHSGARPGVPLHMQQQKDLLWNDESFAAADHPFEKVIVHGDHARPQPFIGKHRIGIDTHAHAGGALTAAVLDQEGCRFLQIKS